MQVDCHSHIFLRNEKMIAARRYTPHYDATLSDYLRMLDSMGSTNGVLIQPSFLGTDNSYLLEGLNRHPQRLRGVVVLDPRIGLSALQALYRQHVMGIRLNLIGRRIPDLRGAIWKRHLRHLADHGWHVQVHDLAKRLPLIVPHLLNSGVRVVVDHFGRPDASLGTRDPGFRYLLGLGKGQRVFVKLSAAYRLAPGVRGEAIALEAAGELLRTFGPQRLVWGTDWPHTQFEAVVNTLATRKALNAWVPDESQRNLILSSTPRDLYQFHPAVDKKAG